jgi:hypothetical protein
MFVDNNLQFITYSKIVCFCESGILIIVIKKAHKLTLSLVELNSPLNALLFLDSF